MKPLAIDLFCGLGGWTEGLLAEGYRVVGFDIEVHRYPVAHINNDDGMKLTAGNSVGARRWDERPIKRLADATRGSALGWQEYPAQLVIQDVLTIHGKQFKDAALIVASPPCQEFSYMAMPWTKAKQKAVEYRNGTRDVKQLTALFDACFRIQREASDVAGHHIPMVVENVRGAQPWVGRSRWNFGSFHLWGDVPALMPMTKQLAKRPGHDWNRFNETGEVSPHWRMDGQDSRKNNGGSWFNIGSPGQKEVGRNPVQALAVSSHRRISEAHRSKSPTKGYGVVTEDGIKQGGISGPRTNGKGDAWFQNGAAKHGSKSSARKAASATIAKIPTVLASWIAKTYYPTDAEAVS